MLRSVDREALLWIVLDVVLQRSIRPEDCRLFSRLEGVCEVVDVDVDAFKGLHVVSVYFVTFFRSGRGRANQTYLLALRDRVALWNPYICAEALPHVPNNRSRMVSKAVELYRSTRLSV